MKILSLISRIIIGAVFTFSGFVKCVDPLGTTYKFTDYFNAFGWEPLTHIALPAAFFMCALELLIGIMLLTNIKTNLAAWGALLFMAVFTPITFYLALYNPVTDCGCFGDALILSNWNTFWKNIVIDIFVVILFISRNKIKPYFRQRYEILLVSVFFVVAIGFEYYNYIHLPIIDFRPYKPGTNIVESMAIPPDAPKDEYESIIYYEKNGETKGFTIENIPDSTWKFVKTETKLLKSGYKPPIHDFNIVTIEENLSENLPVGEDITQKVLSDTSYSFLLIAYNIKKSNIEALKRANEIATYCDTLGIKFYCLSASTTADIREAIRVNSLNYTFYATDEITLKTVIRANPGYVLIKNGVVVENWHFNDIPEVSKLEELYFKPLLKKKE